jgi:hypothetical protein
MRTLNRIWHFIWHNRRSVLRAEIAYLREMLDRTNVDAQRLRTEWDNAYRANEDMTERYNIQRQETERLRMRLSGYEKYPGKTDATHCNTLAEEAAVKRAAGALP